MKRKKRPSPAHPSEKQFLQRVGLYHASNFPFFWKVKAGIGFKPESRLRNVSETTSGYVWPTATIEKMEFGKACETWIHFLYSFLNAPFRSGSGRSEWFLNINPIIGMAFTWWAFSTGRLFVFEWWHYALFWSFPFLWLDYLLWMLLFRALRILFWAAIVLCVAYLLWN